MNMPATSVTNVNDYANQDCIAQIQAAKAAVERMKAARTRAEADHDNYQKRQMELEGEIRALGVEPEKLAEKLDQLRTNIQDNMQKIWSLIPQQFRS